jgi:hypothetical protein
VKEIPDGRLSYRLVLCNCRDGRNDVVAVAIVGFGRPAVTCGHGVFVRFLVGTTGVL